MARIILYSAVSLNGKIARLNGDVDWLDSIPNPDKLDYGYKDFLDEIGLTIQGHNTYKKLLSWNIPFPYPGDEHYVFTRKTDIEDDEHVQFIKSDHLNFTQELKKKSEKDIWLIGGGQINSLLLNAGLIDEMRLFVMPVIIPDGINLFEGTPIESLPNLLGSTAYDTGVMELRYRFS